MYRRILMLVVLSLSLGACVPYSYGDGGSYYSSEVYSSPAPAYYSGGGSYYSAPRYYQPAPVTIRRRVITRRNRATTSPRTVAGEGMTEAVGTATIAAIGTMTAEVMMGEVTTEVDVAVTTVAMATVKQLQKSGVSSAMPISQAKRDL